MPQFVERGPAAGFEHVAVAFVRHEDGEHAAILYCDDRGPATLHMAWHHYVSARELEGEYAWSVPACAPDRLATLSRLCRLVSRRYANRRYPSIAYAFRYIGDKFDDETGEFKCADGLGLTCATFVMALFETRGSPLLLHEGWPSRPEDRAWQEKIVQLLQKTASGDPNIERHVNLVKDDLGCARFRPSEVAAASTASALPLAFEQASVEGQAISDWFEKQKLEAENKKRARASSAP